MTPERLNGLIEEPLRIAKIMGIEVDKETLLQRAQELWGDIDGSKLIEIMNYGTAQQNRCMLLVLCFHSYHKGNLIVDLTIHMLIRYL